MSKVGIVGGGVAGVSAALEASRLGADVALYEASDRMPSRKGSWPLILSGGDASRGTDASLLAKSGVQVHLGEPVRRVDSNYLEFSGSKRKFDSVVLAAGSRPLAEAIPGGTRKGTHVLDSESKFLELRESVGGYSSMVVCGGGIGAAAVADGLLKTGISVTLLAQSGLLSPLLGDGLRNLLTKSANNLGLKVVESRPERVVGVERVEAILASGSVIPCDSVIVVPRTEPSFPPANAEVGRWRAVVVDEFMRSSCPGIYAAGDCAEVRVGSSTLPAIFEASAAAMGRVAGANSAGAHVSTKVSGSYRGELFGVELAFAGLTVGEASSCGLGASQFSKVWHNELACTLVVEDESTVLLGAQLAGTGVSRLADFISLAVSAGLDLRRLAYLETPDPIDISPIAETAREAIASSVTAGQGPNLRPR
jgi:pyruvate/2-oxoglutarate dehydrogenase complex dihydrolipoamide dehydrogenase (E3) component